jgi:N-acetylglucosaminyldiphosphoundecaprenol N-acetyl-beta-D-mannosaminyltransferase
MSNPLVRHEGGAPTAPRSYDVLGIKLTPLTREEIIDLVRQTVETGDQCVLASQNLHGVYVHFNDPDFRTLHNEAYVHIDGMPLVWLGRLFGLPVGKQHRTAWIDWFMLLMQAAEAQGWRVFYLGADQVTIQSGLAKMRAACPGLAIDGRDGFFDATPGGPENEAVVQRINAFRPHVLVVGMGMGRQEKWILENRAALSVNFIGTAGACIEYFAATVPTPPRWLGPLGLEWAYRLASDPKRFAWRYLVEPWLVGGLLLRDLLRRRKAAKE